MGGAHIATYNQIEYFLSTEDYQISVASSANPPQHLVKKISGCKILLI